MANHRVSHKVQPQGGPWPSPGFVTPLLSRQSETKRFCLDTQSRHGRPRNIIF